MARTRKKGDTPTTTAQALGSLIKSCRDIMRKDKGLTTDLDRLPMLTWILFLKFLDDLEQVRETEAQLEGKRFRLAIEPPYRWRDWTAKPDGITGDALIAFINQEEVMLPDGKKGPGLFAYLRSLTGANGGDRRDVIRTVFQGTVNRMLNGYLLRDVLNKVNSIHFTSTEEIYTLGHLYESMLKEMRDAAGENGEFYTPRALVKFIVAVVNPSLGETVLDPACGTGGFLAEAFEHLKTQCQTAEDHRRLQRETLFGIEPKPLPYLLCQMNLLLHGVEMPNIDPLNALRFPLRELGDKDRVDVIITNPPFGGEEERGILGNFPEDSRPLKPRCSSCSSSCASSSAQVSPFLLGEEPGLREAAPRLWCQTARSLATASPRASRGNCSRSSICTPSCACPMACLRPTPASLPTCCSSSAPGRRKTSGITNTPCPKGGRTIQKPNRSSSRNLPR
jgi:type I restriction enzyme M protein